MIRYICKYIAVAQRVNCI